MKRVDTPFFDIFQRACLVLIPWAASNKMKKMCQHPRRKSFLIKRVLNLLSAHHKQFVSYMQWRSLGYDLQYIK